MKPLNLMKNLDTAIFNKIDELENSPGFQKVADFYSTLEEGQQDAIKGLMAALLIVVPGILIYFFSSLNNSALEELELKKEIIAYSNQIIEQKRNVKSQGNKILGRQMIDTQPALEQKITTNMNRIGINTSKLQVKNFEVTDLDANIIEAKIDVKFDGLTNDQIFSAISLLVDQDKMKVDNLNIKKNTSNNLLDGVFTVLYYSKVND